MPIREHNLRRSSLARWGRSTTAKSFPRPCIFVKLSFTGPQREAFQGKLIFVALSAPHQISLPSFQEHLRGDFASCSRGHAEAIGTGTKNGKPVPFPHG